MGRRNKLAGAVVVALFSLTSCFSDDSPPQESVPQGGVDASSGHVVLDDVWVDSAHGIRKGGDATIRLTLTNDGRHPDALISASSPIAHRATLAVHRKPVGQIEVGDQQSMDLEWRDGSGVILHDLRRTISRGEFFNVTFRFMRSPSVTLAVTVGPLGGPLSSPAS
ncbi:MAG: copper chaperone PCu(A)C [Aeromicrobium sp.]